jgi:hypothetical protein
MTFQQRLEDIAIRTAEATATMQIAGAKENYDREVLMRKAAELLVQQRVVCRPSLLLRATLERRGDKFVASYQCLEAEGDTPDSAFLAFDELWTHDHDGSNDPI